jgi:hypothetical protein
LSRLQTRRRLEIFLRRHGDGRRPIQASPLPAPLVAALVPAARVAAPLMRLWALSWLKDTLNFEANGRKWSVLFLLFLPSFNPHNLYISDT